MAEENNKGNKEHKWISEGLLIVAIPALIYYISFGFEMGYCSYFRIPYAVISIDINSIFPTIVVIAFSIIIPLYFYIYRKSSVPRKINFSQRIIIILTVISIALLIVVFKIKIGFVKSIALGVMGIFILTIILFLSNIESIKRDEYWFKLLIWIPAIILSIFSVFEFGNAYGSHNARSKKSFYIYEVNPEIAVLRIYNDRLICAEFDRVNKTVDSAILIINISSNSPVRLHEEEIGPLKPIKKFPEEKEKKE
ncbi:MAG: hypothetical protein JSU85_13605 [Candidatus Zixiibacteriota bacterium]|nr:MAG: hypothetical protein JSU85_13605 [candidate division Zixibacteria bacterium]